MCAAQRQLDTDAPIDLDFWQEQITLIAGKGQRTLAVAALEAGDRKTLSMEDVQGGMTLLGVFGIIDPPRDEAVAAVKSCLSAGIKVKMITGDHALTAAAIGEQIGLDVAGRAITGQELETMDDEQMKFIAGKTNIFARVSLPTNGAQAGIIIASVMMGISLPITPLQILWVNMVTAVTLGLSLAFEPPEGDVMRRPPRSPGEPLLTQFLSWRIAFISSIMVMGTLGLFLWDRHHGESLEMSRTTAVNTLIFFQVFYLFNTRYLTESVFSHEGLIGNSKVLLAVFVIILLQLLFTYLPLFHNLFGTAAIPVSDWGRLIGFTFTVFILVEIEKMIMRREVGNRSPA